MTHVVDTPRILWSVALAGGLAFFSACAGAQEGAVPAAATAASATSLPAQRVKARSLRPGEAAYPAALAERGVQGTAEVLAKLGADGAPSVVTIVSSSRSVELDELALADVRRLRFRSANGASGTSLPDIVVPVEFMRDSLATLKAKTCREFNVDVAYFRSTFPELDTGRMPIINLTTGALFMGAIPTSGLTGDALVTHAKRIREAGSGITAACLAAPDSSYLELYVDLVKKAK